MILQIPIFLLIVFEIYCIFYTQSTFQLRLPTFQVLRVVCVYSGYHIRQCSSRSLFSNNLLKMFPFQYSIIKSDVHQQKLGLIKGVAHTVWLNGNTVEVPNYRSLKIHLGWAFLCRKPVFFSVLRYKSQKGDKLTN